jgi:NAD(P)-dependent dehydrogenase (short-subunit alcohol dehydrogenase family)
MKVVLADIEVDALENAVQALRRQEFDVLGVQADVARPESVEELAQKALDAYGKVHIVCNNAGVVTANEAGRLIGESARPMWEDPLEDWRWTFDINLFGVVHGIHTFVPILLRQGEEGHVVNTASIAGLVQSGNVPIYCATKHAVVVVSEALRLQLAQQAPIGVSVLCPAGVNTRIASATRNRSGEDAPEDDLTGRDQSWTGRIGERGLTPEAVAAAVFEAIQADQFYILPHDVFGDDRENTQIRARMENILARRNP